jgi:hypothetical protein
VEWGEHVEKLERLRAQGKEVRALEARPEMDPSDVSFYRAFTFAAAGRGGMGGGIPPSEVFATVEMYCRLDPASEPDLFDEYVELIHFLDTVSRAAHDEKRKREHPRSHPRGGKRGSR